MPLLLWVKQALFELFIFRGFIIPSLPIPKFTKRVFNSWFTHFFVFWVILVIFRIVVNCRVIENILQLFKGKLEAIFTLFEIVSIFVIVRVGLFDKALSKDTGDLLGLLESPWSLSVKEAVFSKYNFFLPFENELTLRVKVIEIEISFGTYHTYFIYYAVSNSINKCYQ